jgi:hypothetical protein
MHLCKEKALADGSNCDPSNDLFQFSERAFGDGAIRYWCDSQSLRRDLLAGQDLATSDNHLPPVAELSDRVVADAEDYREGDEAACDPMLQVPP